MQVAKELGYRGNLAAKQLRNGRFGAVALLHDAQLMRSLVSRHLVSGILDACQDHKQHFLMDRVSDDRLAMNLFCLRP